METGDKARMTARLTSGLPFRASNIPGYFMPSGSHVGERPDKQHVHLRARTRVACNAPRNGTGRPRELPEGANAEPLAKAGLALLTRTHDQICSRAPRLSERPSQE